MENIEFTSQCDKVTRDMIRRIKIGAFEIFVLPDAAKVFSAMASVRQVGMLDNCQFSVNKVNHLGDIPVTNCIKISRIN